MTKAFCFPKCGNTAITVPPWPPYFGGGAPITPPDPTVLAITCPVVPATAVCGAADVTITITGQAFTAGTIAYLDATALGTTFVGATQLRAVIKPSLEPAARTGTITVQDGGTAGTGACPFTFTAAPRLTVVCPLVPISAVCGSADIPVAVKGTNFTATTEVRVDGVAVPTTFISPTQIEFLAEASLELAPNQITVGAQEGTVIATATCPFDFTQSVLMPTLTKIWPDYFGRSDVGKVVTYTGTNFDATSRVFRGVLELPTTFVDSTTLTTTTVAATSTTGLFEMRVRNGVDPNFEWSDPPLQVNCVSNPILNMLVPASTPAGGAGPVTVQILGQNMGSTTKAIVGGIEVPTVWINGGTVSFDVDPSTAISGNTLQVSVRIGHDHPEGHDDVVPVPGVQYDVLTFTFS